MTDRRRGVANGRKPGRRREALAGVLVALLASLLGACGSPQETAPSPPRAARPAPAPLPRPRVQGYLPLLAEELNRGLPKAIDEDTELTQVEADSKTLRYDYRLLFLTREEVFERGYMEFTDGLNAEAFQRGCTDPFNRDKILKRGHILWFAWNDHAGELVLSVRVTEKDCAEKYPG